MYLLDIEKYFEKSEVEKCAVRAGSHSVKLSDLSRNGANEKEFLTYDR